MDPLIHPSREPGENQRVGGVFGPLGLVAIVLGLWMGSGMLGMPWAGLDAFTVFLRVLTCVLAGSLVLLGAVWVVGPLYRMHRFPGVAWVFGGVCLGIAAFFLATVAYVMLVWTEESFWWADVAAGWSFGVGALDVALLSVLIFRRAVRGADGPRARRALRAAVVLVPIWIVLSFILVNLEKPVDPDRVATRTCIYNVRQLCTILSERSIDHGWPAGGGQAFVLSLLEDGILDAENPWEREVFVCPFHRDPPPARGYFTSYAGRRNDEEAYRLTLEVLRETRGVEPILACLDHEGGAIVGYADGWSRFLDREELGLGPDDPIVVGEASSSPILRKLSDE